MASLLDEYQIPSDLPPMNLQPDPEELRRAQALALMRMGFGVAGGERLGTAMSAGINSWSDAQNQARANARAQMQLALQQHQAQQQYLQDMRRVAFIKGLDENTLTAAGVPKPLIEAVKAAKEPEQALLTLRSFMEPRSVSPGTAVYSPLGGVQFQAPGSKGEVVQYDQASGQPTGFGLLPGAQGVQASLARAQAAGTQAGEFPYRTIQGQGPNGPVMGFQSDVLGTPGAQQSTPYQTNFQGSPDQVRRLQAAAARDFAATGGAPQATRVIEGMSPVSEANRKAAFTSLSADYEKLKTTDSAVVDIYRAQDALKNGAFTGPLSEWKATGINAWNANAPDFLRFNVKEGASTVELQQAMGKQLLENTKALGTNPSNTDAKRIDVIVGSARTPQEALEKGLPWLEALLRRDAMKHNSRVSEYAANGNEVPTNLYVTVPSREQWQKEVDAVTPQSARAPATAGPLTATERARRLEEARRRGLIK